MNRLTKLTVTTAALLWLVVGLPRLKPLLKRNSVFRSRFLQKILNTRNSIRSKWETCLATMSVFMKFSAPFPTMRP